MSGTWCTRTHQAPARAASAEARVAAVEAVIERYGAEHHELAGRAKDMGSAAVFVLMLNVLLTWGLILGPRWL